MITLRDLVSRARHRRAPHAIAIEDGSGGDATALDAFLTDVRRRVVARERAHAGLAGAALLLASVLVASVVGMTPSVGLTVAIVIACAGFAAWLFVRAARWREPTLLSLVESRQPSFRNLLVTARELMAHPDRVKPAIRQRVLRDATTIAHATSIDDVVSPRDTRRAMAAAVVVVLGASLVWYAASRWQARERARDGATTMDDGRGSATAMARVLAAAGIRSIAVVVTPPAYTRRPAISLRDPARIEAIAGSHLRLDVETTTGEAVVTFNDRPQTLTAAPPGATSPSSPASPSAAESSGSTPPRRAGVHASRAELTLAETGVLSISARSGEARAAGRAVGRAADADASAGARADGAPHLIAVTVVPDDAPAVEMVVPGRDLLFGDASARVEFVARAQDDLGLRTLALRYTKVSGSGEQYEFHEGELPLTLDRRDGRQWQGRLARSLRELELSPGDLFVYYAAATDGRPDAAAARAVSDSYVIEIGKGETAIAGGFAIPPDEDRFAISLNALIQKTEKLHARRAAMAAAAFEDAAQALAVEQRMVRTEFLFTMGFHGHVEDEEVEAEHSHEIQEGRLENRGQAEMVQATRLMTSAERQLTAADTGEALKSQRGALAAIQRALSRHRYFLRTLLTSSDIDLTRRLTGDLSAATSARWPAHERPPDERRARARLVLADLARLSRALDRRDDDPSHAAAGASVPSSQLANPAASPGGSRPRSAAPAQAADAAAQDAGPSAATSSPANPAANATDSGPRSAAPAQAADAAAQDAGAALASLATTLASRVLSLDPASAALQGASAALSEAAGHIGAGRTREGLSLVRKAADAVLPLAQPSVRGTASTPLTSTPSDPALRGAVVDALRR